MRKSTYQAYKPEPNASSTGGRNTPETSGQSKTDSRGGASGQQRTQIAGEASTSTDAPEGDKDGAKTVLACPHCDSTALARRGSQMHGPEPTGEYYCKGCCTPVEEAVEREQADESGLCGLARVLDEMDPDDVGRPMTDGGPGAGPNGEDLNTTQAVFRALEELGGEREEAPVGNVINRVVVNHERPLEEVLDEVSQLIANGEIYAPSPATIQRTDAPVTTDGGPKSCRKCGEADWRDDDRFANLTCGACGWMPPKNRRDEIRSAIAMTDGGEDIEGLDPMEGTEIADFHKLAEEQSRGASILEEPEDVELTLVEVSASYVDPEGILRTFSITADGFDPSDYDHDLDDKQGGDHDA